MTARISESRAAARDSLETFERTAPIYDVLTVHPDYGRWTGRASRARVYAERCRCSPTSAASAFT